jgi:ribonuclease P protein component
MKGEVHLTKPVQYAYVYNEGSSWVNNLLVMKATPNALEYSRYGFSVSKRVGTAVVRNRTKRLLREILRAIPLKEGWDIVFIARNSAAHADYRELSATVEKLLSRARLVAL